MSNLRYEYVMIFEYFLKPLVVISHSWHGYEIMDFQMQYLKRIKPTLTMCYVNTEFLSI